MEVDIEKYMDKTGLSFGIDYEMSHEAKNFLFNEKYV